MDLDLAVGSQDLKKDRSQAQEANEAAMPLAVQPQSHASTDMVADSGAHGALPNGVSENGGLPATTNGAVKTPHMELNEAHDPPQLDQSWRQHASNKSLGRVIERLAQKCYKDLDSTIKKMAEVSIESQRDQPNGIASHTGEDTSEASLQKKRMILEFAKDQRDAFIKTLVLTDWSRNEEDQSKLIDVKVWQDKQRQAQFNATRAVGQTKVNMIPAKVPAPNIEGAMELLATGAASWVPDMGYISPARLSSKQLLKTLRNMNVILATRLNLHEDLPAHFADFSIADGRATFTVKDEFEVDLSVADEDPTTPFYFIDIRFLFHPAPHALNDRLRGFVEAKVNHELGTKGLKGCYDFLHNFVITHKINILRDQAADLVRGKWFDCIRPENMRRSFIVQYWAGIPGKKSWIEFGVDSGKQNKRVPQQATNPQISVRWFRNGVEVPQKDLDFEFDWRHISLQGCLTAVIRKHIDWILRGLDTRIRSLIGPDSQTSSRLQSVEGEAETPVLVLGQKSLKEQLHVCMEPTTGQFSITPPSRAAAAAEQQLNANPNIDAANKLASLVCAVSQARLNKATELLGWKTTPRLARQENTKQLFGESVRLLSVFSPRSAWGDNWALAVTFTLNGETFWAVSLDEKRGEQGNITGRIITSALRIPRPSAASLSRAALRSIERSAVAEVSLNALAKQLSQMSIPYSLVKMTGETGSAEKRNYDFPSATGMLLQFSPLIPLAREQAGQPWAAEIIRLTHRGIEQDGSVRHDLRLIVEADRLNHLRKRLTQREDRDLAMNATGGLALRVRSPFGLGFVHQIQARLRHVQRLDYWLAVLKKHHCKCSRASLSQLDFTYDEKLGLEMHMTLSDDGGSPARLSFLPAATNPHQRIRVVLQQWLNEAVGRRFEAVVALLKFTLPALQALDRLENINPTKRTVAVHVRSPYSYAIQYQAPLHPCGFDIRARSRVEQQRTRIRWHISPSKSGTVLPAELTTALSELWQSHGEHWQGLRIGAIADVSGVAPLLEKLDEVVRRFEMAVPIAPAKPEPVATPAEPVKAEAAKPAPVAAQIKQQAAMATSISPPAKVKKEPEIITLD